MKVGVVLIISLMLGGCIEGDQKPNSRKDRSEVVQVLEKTQREKNDTVESSAVYEEYLGEELKQIRQNFKRINKVKHWTLIDEVELDQSTERGVATYYFLADTLLKVVAIHFGETGKKINEFYTENGQLSFVFEQEYQYNRPITWDSIAMKENNDTEVFDFEKSEIIEDRNYFKNGDLIRKMITYDCGAPFDEEYLLEEQIRLKSEFEKLKERLKKKHI